ncbi:MAG: sulfotransferase domain-containing protein [bacterium]
MNRMLDFGMMKRLTNWSTLSGRWSLSKTWWDLKRFGMTPDKIWRRRGRPGLPRIFCVSIPKAGTHLLERMLCLHPRLYRKFMSTLFNSHLDKYRGLANIARGLKPGQILVSHLHYSEQRRQVLADQGIKVLFMIRDPRDVAVSEAFYIRRKKDHYLHSLYAREPDLRSALLLEIRGDAAAGHPPLGERLGSFLGWMREPSGVVRFEDLIGEEGGGGRQTQMEVIQRLFDFLEMDISPAEIDKIRRGLFSGASPTFRKGKIGEWRKHFDEEITDLFKQTAGEMLVRYGFEKDLDW